MDPGWPRRYTNGTAELVVYQPQVDAWTEFKTLTGRCAFALMLVRGGEFVYGTFLFSADTLVDAGQKLVLLRNVRASDMRFPGAPGGTSAEWAALTKRLLPSDALIVSLDRLLAFVRAAEVPRTEARVLTDPPPILVSTQPAVLVIINGDPVIVDVENASLRRIVNTNWELYQDRRTSAYYLSAEKPWLKATTLSGTFALAPDIPQDLIRAAANEKAGPATTPVAVRVIVVNRPAEVRPGQGIVQPLTFGRPGGSNATPMAYVLDFLSGQGKP